MPGTTAHQIVDVLALVLQRVPQQERLQSCALTCRSWRAAANQATTDISLEVAPEQQEQTSFKRALVLNTWLQRYGSLLRSLELKLGSAKTMDIPLSVQLLGQLQHLHLNFSSSSRYTSCYASSSSSSNPLSALASSLTALELHDFAVHCPSKMAAVAVLTKMRRLQLVGAAVQHAAARWQAEGTASGLCDPLGQLVQLTHLQLAETSGNSSSGCIAVPPAALQAISRMTALQRLELAVKACKQLPELPASLRSLNLHDQPDYVFGGPGDGVSQLTGLQKLHLKDIGDIQPTALRSMTSLWYMALDLPAADYITQLLPVLAGLTRLKHLFLAYTDPRDALQAEGWADEEIIDPEPYAALTASTKLVFLGIMGALPAKAGRYMFAEDRVLPELRHVVFDAKLPFWNNMTLYEYADAVSSSRMVAACPALEQLHLSEAGCGVVLLDDLRHVSTLTELTYQGLCDEEAEQCLPHLTQLRHLELYHTTELSDAGAMHLTALTGLTSLTITGECLMTVGRA
jgi:hypothetical protein